MTLHKLIVLTSIFAIAQPAQAAPASKVRLAVNLGARAIKATALAAKAHLFRTATITSAIAFASYVKYQHGKYDRRVAPLEKRLKKERAYRNSAIKEALGIAAQHSSGGNLTCPQGIVDIVNAYAEEDTINDCKATAARVKRMTFQEYVRKILQEPFSNNFTQNELTFVISPVIPLNYLILGLPCEFCILTLEYGARKALGRIPYYAKSGERILNWQDVKSIMKNDFKFAGAIMIASTAVSAAILVKKWLRTREQAAAGQP